MITEPSEAGSTACCNAELVIAVGSGCPSEGARVYRIDDVVLIDEEVNPESLDVDDVIRIMDGDETPIRRIVAIDESEDGLIFTVRGDNLPDTEEVTEEDLAGLIVLNVPEVGDVVIWWRE